MSSKEMFERWLNENEYRFSHVNLASIEADLYSLWVMARAQGKRDCLDVISSIHKHDISLAGNKVTRAYFNGFNAGVEKCFKSIDGVEKCNEGIIN